MLRTLLAALLLPLAARATEPASHGPVILEATDHDAVVWARAPGPGTLELRVRPRPSGGGRIQIQPDPAHDLTGSVHLEGLRPGTRYTLELRAVDADGHRSEPVVASFRTAPAPDDPAAVRFALSGDLGGQGRCRRLGADDVELGYPIFAAMSALRPDFFIFNGDQIYADNLCLLEGPVESELGVPWRNLPGPAREVGNPEISWEDATTLREIFWEHWRYNRGEAHLQALLRQTVMYPQWDDHEVINDHGMSWERWRKAEDRPGYPTLVAEGAAAFHDYNPVSAQAPEGRGVYRSFRWGADLELFLVDARSFRSPNSQPDGEGKSMLGSTQRDWLVQGILASDATFKVVSVDVPLAQPTGSQAGENGRDGWADGASDEDPDEGAAATGFEHELRAILLALDQAHARGVVFLSADVHFAQIARFSEDLDGDGEPLVLHEIIAGPLSAGTSKAVQPDPSLNPQVLYAEGGLFNFALFEVERLAGVPTLRARIFGEDGRPRPGGELILPAQ